MGESNIIICSQGVYACALPKIDLVEYWDVTMF
jgi:hypothetical protein